MSTNLVISIVGAPGDSSSYVTTDARNTLQNLSFLLDQIKSGAQTTVTLGTLTAAVKASATVTFSAACSPADTVTANAVAFTAAQLAARNTAIFATIVDGNVLTVNGTAFTAKATVTNSVIQFALGASDTDAVNNAVTVINAHPVVSKSIIAAASVGGADKTVLLKAVTEGTAGNALTLAATGVPITVGNATFTNGAAAVGNQFDYGDTANQAAVSLAASVTRSATAGVVGVFTAAVTATGVATVTAFTGGTMGNAITLAKSGANIAVTGGGRLASGAGTSSSFNF